MVICLDAGHGGKDPGAVSKSHKEKDITLKITLKLANEIRKQGGVVILTREDDSYVSLENRCKIANSDSLCIVFVSIHVNSSTNPNASGCEFYIYNNLTSNQMLAELIQKHFTEETESKTRGIKINPALYVLKHTVMTSILVEVGFISNEDDLEKLKDENHIDKIVKGLTKGICKFSGLSYNEKDNFIENSVNSPKIYHKLNEIPSYYIDDIKDVIELDALKGTENDDLNLSEDLLRSIVIANRIVKKRLELVSK